MYVSIYLSIYVSIYVSIYLSSYLSIYLSIHLSIYLSEGKQLCEMSKTKQFCKTFLPKKSELRNEEFLWNFQAGEFDKSEA